LKEKKIKKRRIINRILQIFCFYSLGFQKEVCHFRLLFIYLLPLKKSYSLSKFEEAFEDIRKKTTEIAKKL
jgi:hypothetical protein